MLEALGMCEEHDTDGEGSEAELVGNENFAGSANGTTTMMQTKLGWHDENVWITLGIREFIPEPDGALGLTEFIGAKLALAVVAEPVARLLERVQHLLRGLVV